MVTEALFDEVVRKAGGLSALAKMLDESLQAVSNWRSRGFPASKCKAIERATGVDVRRLRPDDWRDYWPDDLMVQDSDLKV